MRTHYQIFYSTGRLELGKTSTIIALARQMYKDEYSKLVLELNASDDRGIDVVRDQIKVFADSMALTMSMYALP